MVNYFQLFLNKVLTTSLGVISIQQVGVRRESDISEHYINNRLTDRIKAEEKKQSNKKGQQISLLLAAFEEGQRKK